MSPLKPSVILLLIIITYSSGLKAQSDNPSFLLGINPSVTVEPFYQRGEFDVNIFPLVYQRPLTGRLDLRLTSILNLGVRNAGNQISHAGLETALPIFLFTNESPISTGFFLAPILSLTRNRLENHNNLGLWLEPGYQFSIAKKTTLSVGIQLGATLFDYDESPNDWGSHFGVNVIIGRWF